MSYWMTAILHLYSNRKQHQNTVFVFSILKCENLDVKSYYATWKFQLCLSLVLNDRFDRYSGEARLNLVIGLVTTCYGRKTVWPYLAKFHHLSKIIKVFGNFLAFILYSAQFWTYFGNCFMLLGKFSWL